MVCIGRLGSPHGINGVLKFYPELSQEELLSGLEKIFISSGQEKFSAFKVREIKPLGGKWGIGLDGISNPEEARILVNSDVYVDDAFLPPLPENKYYHKDLAGLDVFDEKGESVGVVENVTSYPANDVLEIRSGKKLYLVPIIKDAVVSVKPDKKKIVVKKAFLV